MKTLRYLILLAPLLVCSMKPIESIQVLEPCDFKSQLEKTEGLLIDLRSYDEYNKEKIAGAINMDVKAEDFGLHIRGLDKDGTYFVYGGEGDRGTYAVDVMKKTGFRHIYDLKGGVAAWKQEGLPLSE